MNNIIYLLCVISFFSCTSDSDRIKESLKQAGDNQVELEKVIQYYSEHVEDSLKLKSAIFLIEHMPFYGSFYGTRVDSVDQYFEDIREPKSSVINDKSRETISLEMLEKYSQQGLSHSYIYDNKKVSFKYLVNNIEMAFRAWDNATWKDSVSFEQFCEYILPYRIRNEKLEYWRNSIYENYLQDTSLYNSSRSMSNLYQRYAINGMRDIGPHDFYQNYRYEMNYDQMNLMTMGSCIENTCLNLYRLRALGFPATYDYVTNWGNRAVNLHAMIGDATKGKQTVHLFSNINEPIDSTNLVSNAMRLHHDFKDDDLPKGLYVQHIKTVSKVWRYTWSVNEEILGIYENAPTQEIYRPLLKVNITDVSNQYVDVADIKIELSEKFSDYKVVYLAVFDRSGWEPVAYGVPNKGGLVEFNNIGKHILYLPVVYDLNSCIPIGDPFVVDDDGDIKKKSLNRAKMQDVKILRKFPLFGSIAENSLNMKDIYFEGANSPDFKDAQLLHKLDYYPFDMERVKVSNPNKFRYVRCCLSETVGSDIVELEYYGKVGQDTILLKGTPFIHPDYTKERTLKAVALAFDGDYLTRYGTSPKINNWFALDLGDNNASEITDIHYCTKTDANFIIPNNDYELYYWDDEWVFFDDVKADDYFLEFRDVPSDGVYWLKCTTEGREERAFTYEDGTQIWW